MSDATDTSAEAVMIGDRPQSPANRLRGYAAMIASGGFTVGQDETWLSAAIQRAADEVAALLAERDAARAAAHRLLAALDRDHARGETFSAAVSVAAAAIRALPVKDKADE